MVIDIEKYIKENTAEKTLYENVNTDNFLYLVLYKDFAEIKFNIVNLVIVNNIDILCDEFIKGNYFIKLFLNNGNLLYSKFIWKDKKLRQYNQKTKYGFLRFKKINKIQKIQGIMW